MKSLIAFSLVTSVLLAIAAAGPSYGAAFKPYGSARSLPGGKAPKPPGDIDPDVGARRRDDRPYRPPVVLLPEGKGSPAYEQYVEREFRRDPDGGYVGYRRSRPWELWKVRSRRRGE